MRYNQQMGLLFSHLQNPKQHSNILQLNREDYTLIISDLRMPSINGMELIKKIKELNPYIRTILMTAFAINDDLFYEYAKKELINGFLQKPIHLGDLRAEVNNQLYTYELLKQESFIN